MNTVDVPKNINNLDTYRKKIRQEVWLVLLVSFFVYLVAHRFDPIDKLVIFMQRYEKYEVDELLAVALFLVVGLALFAVKRWRELLLTVMLVQDKNRQLEKAIQEIHVLKEIIPICSYCKKIRNDEGYWKTLESYITEYSGAKLSHGICPDCLKEHFPEVKIDDEEFVKKGV